MKIDLKIPIATLAAEHPAAMPLFESLGIDYFCAGDQSIEDAAHAAAVDPALVMASLRSLSESDERPWSERPLSEIVRHLTIEHHRLVREELARIALRLHDNDWPALRYAFTRFASILLPHMQHEEDVIFPMIENLEANPSSSRQRLHAELVHCLNEHATLAGLLTGMRELRLALSATNGLAPESEKLLETIAALIAHMHRYLFLENCVLFPRAVAENTKNH